MAGRRSLNGAFEKAVAAGCWQAGRQWNTFPGNRFSLELVDVLLETPVVFPLKQPNVTVGMFGENTWNLPLESLFGSELFKILRTRWEGHEWVRRPFLLLDFNAETCTWRAVQKYHREPSNSNIPDDITFVVEPGVKVDIGIGIEQDDDCLDTENFGFFSVILHDANGQPQSPAASTFIQKLASLPPVALGMIASHLKPFECIHNFCPLSPSIPQKLRAVEVQWSELTFSGIGGEHERYAEAKVGLRTLLDCLRALKLVAAGDTFKSLYLGDGQGEDDIDDAWRMSYYVREQIFRAAKKLIFAPKLQDLWLAASWLSFFDPTAPLPCALQTVYIGQDGCMAPHDTCCNVWNQLSRLKLPVAAEVHLVRKDFIRYEWKVESTKYPTSGFSLPNVTSVHLEACKHSPFLPPKALPNLKKLELKCSTLLVEIGELGWDSFCRVISDTLRVSSFPKLRKASLQMDRQTSMSKIVAALATAATNLKVLRLTVPIADSTDDETEKSAGDQESLVKHLTATVGPLRRFLTLERLKISFTRPAASADALESLLHFGLALLGTKVSIVELDCVDCSDVWSKRVLSVTELLKQSGKDVLLTRRAPERIDLTSSCWTYPRKGLCDYKVTVHDQGLQLGND